jgi:hypothetical protein
MKLFFVVALFIAQATSAIANGHRCTTPQGLNARFNLIACKAAHSVGFYNDYDQSTSLCVKHTNTRRVCTTQDNLRYIDATVSYARNSGLVSRGSVRFDDRADCRIYLTSTNTIAATPDCSRED